MGLELLLIILIPVATFIIGVSVVRNDPSEFPFVVIILSIWIILSAGYGYSLTTHSSERQGWCDAHDHQTFVDIHKTNDEIYCKDKQGTVTRYSYK